MTLDLDSVTVPVPCPHCGHKIEQSLGWLKDNPDICCPICRQTFSANGDKLRRQLDMLRKI